MALIEAVGSSLAVMGSARGLVPASSVTRKEVNLHPARKMEEESLFIEDQNSPSLGRRPGEVPPIEVPNLRHRRPPRPKRMYWCTSTIVQFTVLTVLLGAAAIIAKVCLSLDWSALDLTDRDVYQERRTEHFNGTSLNDTDFVSTVDSLNQTRLDETEVSGVRKTQVEIGSSLGSSMAQPKQSAYTGRHLQTFSAPTTDSATFVVKHTAASGPVIPVLSLLAANLKRKHYQPSRPNWLEPDKWTPHSVNGTENTTSS